MRCNLMSRRSFLYVSAAAAVGGVLAACTPQAAKETVVVEKETLQEVTSVVEQEVTVTPAPGGAVEITYWNPDVPTWQPAYQEQAKTFMELNPDITVKVQNVPEEGFLEKINAMIAGGVGPDVWAFYYAVDVARRGFLQNLTPYMERDNVDPDKLWFPLCVMRGVYNDQHYGVPRDGFWALISYNKDLLAEFGLSEPSTGWTLEDYLSACRTLTDKQKGTWGTSISGCGALCWDSAFCWNTGFELVSEDGRKVQGLLDSPDSIWAIQWMLDLETVHQVAPSGAQAQALGDDPFISGKIGFGPASSGWGVVTLRPPELNWGLVECPVKEKGAPSYAWGDSVQFYMWTGSRQKEGAWKLMNYISGVKGSQVAAEKGGWSPPCPEAWKNLGWDRDPIVGAFWAEAQKPTFVPNYLRTEFHWDCVGTHFCDIWTRYIENEERPLEAVVTDAAEKAQKCLDERYAST